MLVLSRMLGEDIWIEPGHIRITVVGLLSGGKVRLGIEAPEKLTILRGELVGRYDRLRKLAEKEERNRKEGGPTDGNAKD